MIPMSEPSPQFTYSPEGVLKVTVNYDSRLGDRQVIGVEGLGEYNGAEINEDIDSTSIEIDVQRAIGSNFNNAGDERILEFLSHLSAALPYRIKDSSDRVATLDTITNRGTFAGVYPHFQRWLNQGLDEEAGTECVLALATPFGKSMTDKAAKTMQDLGNGFRGFAFGVGLHPDRFRIFPEEPLDKGTPSKMGEVTWQWLDIQTLGDCACWGVNGDNRESIYLTPGDARLYEMSPHNVDFARQHLSQILGLGALAYRASQYEGKEDIFAETVWVQ